MCPSTLSTNGSAVLMLGVVLVLDRYYSALRAHFVQARWRWRVKRVKGVEKGGYWLERNRAAA